MDERQARGLTIAKTKRVKKTKGKLWLVPSQTHSGTYVVDVGQRSCTCPDHEATQGTCKHLWAVEYVRRRVTAPDGSTVVTEMMRVSYTQDWASYNAAQTTEKEHVQTLLRGLCDGIVQPPQGKGRPRLPLGDVIYGATMKVFTGMSGRRATTDIRECANKGLIDETPHYNSLFNYVEKPELTPLLKVLVEESASPLAEVETKFAVDATGFATSVYDRWFDHKYGRVQKKQTWIKAHVMTGVQTNIVTGIEVTEGDANDSPHLPHLLARTDRRFEVAEVVADKGYLSRGNVAAINHVGAVPYIPFKTNSTARGSQSWKKLWHLYSFQRDVFATHYHARSNAESTFSMIKRKFGGSVRSKLFVAQVNEVLLKTLCHNLSVLVHSFHELGIDQPFWRA